MLEMQCLYQESPTKLLMGGHQDKLLELDITKMVETVIVSKHQHLIQEHLSFSFLFGMELAIVWAPDVC